MPVIPTSTHHTSLYKAAYHSFISQHTCCIRVSSIAQPPQCAKQHKYAMAPSLCGSVVSSKRSLLALGWTLTSLLSLAAFITAAIYAVHVRTHYRHIAQTYTTNNDDYYSNYNCEGGDGGEGCRSHDSRDSQDEAYYYNSLASVSSGSMTFAGIYTATVAVGLSLYGSLAIVGFSSVRGQYIAPCLGGGGTAVQSRMHLGIFMGALILFSCLCLVCAVVFGEFRVSCACKDGYPWRKEIYECLNI